jgi:NADPH2:quinone reductase
VRLAIRRLVHLAGEPGPLLPAVRHGGRFVSTLIGSPDQIPAENLAVVPVAANPAAATLDRLARNEAEGTSHVVVHKVYPLDGTPAALADFGAVSLGKLVVSTQ